MKGFCATFLFASGIVLPVFAQLPPAQAPSTPTTVLSLSEAIKKSVAFSPAISVANFEVAEAKAKKSEANAASFLPEFSALVVGGPVPDVPEGSGPENNFPTVNNNDFGNMGPFVRARIEALQPIYTFGKISNLQNAAKHNVAAKELQKTVARNELVFNVKRAYYTLCFLYSLEEFINELNDRTLKAKQKIEERLKSGSGEATDIDLIRLEVFRAETEKRMFELRSGINFARETLGVLTGLNPSGVDIAEKNISIKKIDLQPIEHYLARTKVARPEVTQLDEATKAADAFSDSVKANFYPSLFIAGFYTYAKAPGRDLVNNPFLVNDFNVHTGGAFLGLKQDLSFLRTTAKYKQANAQYKKITAQRQLALQGIEIEVRKSYNDFVAKQSSYDASERAFKAGRSWVLASTLNFGAGLVPIKDLLEAFIAYTTVKANYLDIMYDFNISLSQLTRSVGEELSDVQY